MHMISTCKLRNLMHIISKQRNGAASSLYGSGSTPADIWPHQVRAGFQKFESGRSLKVSDDILSHYYICVTSVLRHTEQTFKDKHVIDVIKILSKKLCCCCIVHTTNRVLTIYWQ